MQHTPSPVTQQPDSEQAMWPQSPAGGEFLTLSALNAPQSY